MAKATTVANAYGITLLGVRDFEEDVTRPGDVSQSAGPDYMAAKGKARLMAAEPGPDLGFSLTHTGTLLLAARTEFRVSPMQ